MSTKNDDRNKRTGMQNAVHGGDIYRNDVRLDFSVSVNPLPLPQELRDAACAAVEHLDRYPDIQAEELRREIAQLSHVAPDEVLVGNGASELLMAIAHAFRPRHALLVSPCYSGYTHALHAAANMGRFAAYPLVPENDFALTRDFLQAITDETDMVILADPNNPTGRRIEPALLKEIADRCAQLQIPLVLDACFAPLAGGGTHDACFAPLAGGGTHNACFAPCVDIDTSHRSLPNVVLRVCAFTKTLALPGLRLGYLIARRADWREQIAAQLPEWNTSVLAQEMGAEAARILRETDYLARSVEQIRAEREYLTGALRELGFRVCKSDANYLLVGGAAGLYKALLAKGILVRDCANFDGLDDSWIRIAVRTHAENRQLIEAIGEICATIAEKRRNA